ncbi:DUF6115 domain-containing protein [Halalkalibacter krulwichiae]|uniref:Uncharacterized protein n=1 Tax=Halalkalibacter krulwichiae TaxID=199441 RepID=A0A1X9MC41_9BACI|nr:response regulator transcription factor [Halalkalibacter krulwichiae]ARK30976.1 hypothetical protein BkAM31D_14645 [Halalkalibacter krulwichiae]
MTTILVTISLLLHGITFLFLLTRQQQQTNYQNEMETMKNEMEDLLITYITELKEENERLVMELKKRNHSNENQKMVELKSENMKEFEVSVSKSKKEDTHYETYSPPSVEDEEQSFYEQSDTAKVLGLAAQGLSAKEIAEKLKLGKGEVELMLKFYR